MLELLDIVLTAFYNSISWRSLQSQWDFVVQSCTYVCNILSFSFKKLLVFRHLNSPDTTVGTSDFNGGPERW